MLYNKKPSPGGVGFSLFGKVAIRLFKIMNWSNWNGHAGTRQGLCP